MRKLGFLAIACSIALSGCNQPQSGTDNAEDFARRVNGGQQAAPQSIETLAPASPNALPHTAVPRPPAEGYMPENAMAKCDAQKIKPFYGKPDSPEIRYAILAAIAPKSNVRYLKPGSNLAPDPESDRLNVMIDVTGIIRDARCG